MNKVASVYNTLNKNKNVLESTLLIENGKGEVLFQGETDRTIHTPMLMASVSKLVTTTCILNLVDKGLVQLEDPIFNYLNDVEYEPIQEMLKTHDIESLLRQTTGFNDYYLAKDVAVFKKVIDHDFSFNLDDEITWITSMKHRFKTKQTTRSFYTDFNFTLLGQVIESITQKPLHQVIKEVVVEPLQLKKTFLATKSTKNIPYTYYGQAQFNRPKFIQSSYAGGGIVTTAKELMIFLKAFYQGQLFEQRHIDFTAKTNPLQLSFYPIRYGLGMMHIKVSMPFKKSIHLFGHSGSTGAFAFYSPFHDVYMVGDVPQVKTPSKPIRLVMRTILKLPKSTV